LFNVSGLKKLHKKAVADYPLVVYRKDQWVTLTAIGEQEALEVIHPHRLLETYQGRMLGFVQSAARGNPPLTA
jgi:Mn-dependent DtxR family transcriptional regulator